MAYKVIFWSSVDPSAVLEETVTSLRASGIDVGVKYLISDAKYRGAKGFFKKIILRLLMYVAYPAHLTLFLLRNKRNKVINVVTSNTFFAPCLANIFANKNHKTIHLVWDLYPSVLGAKFKSSFPTNLASSVIKFLVGYSFMRSSANVFIGDALLKSANCEFNEIPNSVIIPVGANDSHFAKFPPAFVRPEDKVHLLYCGNLGVMHDVSTLINFFSSDTLIKNFNNSIAITFNASGFRYQYFIEKILGINNSVTRNCIKLEGPLAKGDWLMHMRRSHIAIVTMSEGSDCAVLPSKTYSALSAGQAILAICPKKSDLARLVEILKCGWVIEPGDVIGLSSVFSEIINNRELLFEKQSNSFLAGQGQYSASSIAEKWLNLFHKVAPL